MSKILEYAFDNLFYFADPDLVLDRKVVTQIEVVAEVMTVITQMGVTVTQVTVVILIAIQIIAEVEAEVEVRSVVTHLVQIGKIISNNHRKMKVVAL